MKIKDGFILRQVASSNIVVPIGNAQVSFNGIMTLNEVGTLVWKKLEEGCDRQGLIDAVTAEYDVDAQTAGKDIDIYIEKLRQKGLIED
ncbi:MAG: PqqD family protein [Clostridia bacterium]|nr:PqqD family protein [Clostridia bacterium]